nr:Transposon Ty3-G Gag-Pol polyprotein [Ipomoea batatas]
MPATTPLSNRQALFRANPGLPIATDEGSSDGAPVVQKHNSMRLDIPKYGGADPQQWIFNIQEYFDFHQIAEPQRLQIAVEQRFGTTHFEDPLAELAKLTQIGTVAEFQAAFEKLLNRATGVTETQLVSYVIGGLKSHLRRELLLSRPRTILAAFELAKAHEARHNELMLECRHVRPSANSQLNALPPGKTNAREFLPAPMAQPTPALPIRKYTAAEIREKRDKGLCFRCDQKYFPGHRCKGRFLLLIGDEDDETVEGDPVVVEDYHTDEEVISGDVSVLNTMTGPGSPRSLRLTGNIKGSSCLVLIDSGSTHNFITPAIVERLQLPTKSIKPFQVYIGNGDTLGCQHVCPGVEVCMQGLTFAVDLHVLRIVGPDVVLGVQWLQSLGSVTHDYSKMTMEFHMGSTIVTLKGDSSLNNQPISFNQLQAMVTNGAIQTLYEIHHINTTNSTEPAQIQPTLPPFPEPLQDLLLEFSAIFEPPKTLPPHRVFDHKIHLLPNSKPVNVRPYRYPYFQKSEIEKLVREMLDQGIPHGVPVQEPQQVQAVLQQLVQPAVQVPVHVPVHHPVQVPVEPDVITQPEVEDNQWEIPDDILDAHWHQVDLHTGGNAGGVSLTTTNRIDVTPIQSCCHDHATATAQQGMTSKGKAVKAPSKDRRKKLPIRKYATRSKAFKSSFFGNDKDPIQLD